MTLHHGDCLQVMAGMGDGCVDAVVTDPPYGLEFMGREWDAPWQAGAGIGGNSAAFRTKRYKDGSTAPLPNYTGGTNPTCRNCGGLRSGTDSKKGQRPCRCDAPRFDNVTLPRMQAYQAWCETWAVECLRVLRPGGYLLAFGGTRTYHRLASAIEDAGFEIRDSLHWLYGSGFPKGKACLKPAHEPIVMARKPARRMVPLPGLDACRVAHGEDVDLTRMEHQRNRHDGKESWRLVSYDGPLYAPAGRWPPNVLLDEDAATELDHQSGTLVGCGGPKRTDSGDTSIFGIGQPGRTYEREGGGASRFFPVFRYQAKAPAHERPRLPDGTAWPTVKPLALMRWLVRLVTPPGGTILDPFAGTGTTLQAAALEGFQAIGIERDPIAVQLAQQRLAQGALTEEATA